DRIVIDEGTAESQQNGGQRGPVRSCELATNAVEEIEPYERNQQTHNADGDLIRQRVAVGRPWRVFPKRLQNIVRRHDSQRPDARGAHRPLVGAATQLCSISWRRYIVVWD